MIDSSIALGVRPIQTTDPMEAYGKVLSLKHMIAQGPIQAEQLKAVQLENQQRQQGIDAQTAFDEAYKTHTEVGPDGTPSVNWGGVVNTLASSGKGHLIPGVIQSSTKLKQEAATYVKTDTENKRNIGELAAQTIRGVAALPPEQQAAGWQAVLPKVISATKAMGVDPSAIIPAQWDSKRAAGLMQMWQKTSDTLTEQYHAADFALRQSAEAPKTLKAWTDQINDDGAQNATSQAGLDAMRKKWEALKAPKEVMSEIPATWTPEVQDKFKASVIPLEKQPDYEAKVEAAASKTLAAAADKGKDAYAEAYWKSSPSVRALVDHPDQFNPETSKQKAIDAGLTSAEQMSAAMRRESMDNMATFHEDSLNLRSQLLTERKGQTANSEAVDRRKARTDFTKSTDKERELWNLTTSLRNAITNKVNYVTKYGNVVPMTKAAGYGGEALDGLVDDMKGRLGVTVNALKDAVSAKYDAMERLGATPSVKLEDVLADLNRIGVKQEPQAGAGAKTGGPVQQTLPAPAPAPAPAPTPAPQPTATKTAVPAKPKQRWVVKGQTFEQGQPIMSGGKKLVVTGFNPVTGKLQTAPAVE